MLIKNLFQLLVITCYLCFAPIAFSAEKNLIVLHTNDIHCGVEDNLGLAKLAAYKKQLQHSNNVLLADSGDAVQGTPLGRLSDGLAITELMNITGYDFAVPGNHEFDYGMSAFFKLAQKLNCGYYSANFFDLRTRRAVLPSYKIFDIEGRKIALIGVTTPQTLTTSTPLFFQNQQGAFIYSFCESKTGDKLYKNIQQNIDTVKALGADYVFLISHLGLNGTLPQYSVAAVIKNTAGLDGVLDGHSHEIINGLYFTDKAGRQVLVGQTGTKMQNIGQLTITPAGKISYTLINRLTETDPATAAAINKANSTYAPLLSQPVGKTLVPLYVNDSKDGKRLVRSQECNMGDFAADAYRSILGSDIAIVNGGGIRADFKKGYLSYNDILKAFPFGNMCSVIEVTGQQLLDALEHGAAACPDESGGFLQVSGLSFTIDTTQPSAVQKDERGNFTGVNGKYRVQNVLVSGKPLELNKKYTLGGTSYLLTNGGNGMTMFKHAPLLKNQWINETDAVIEYLQNVLNGVINEKYAHPYGDGRITIIK